MTKKKKAKKRMTSLNLTAFSVIIDGNTFIFDCDDSTTLNLTLDSVTVLDELEEAVEDLKGDLTAFLREDMTIEEVAEVFNESPGNILDIINSYTYRR
jgi:hypothetical protein